MVSELCSGRTAIHILVAEINKVLLAEAALGLNARCDRFGKRYCNVGFVTGEDFLAAVVASIGNGFEFVDAEDGLRLALRKGFQTPFSTLNKNAIVIQTGTTKLRRAFRVAGEFRLKSLSEREFGVGALQRMCYVGIRPAISRKGNQIGGIGVCRVSPLSRTSSAKRI